MDGTITTPLMCTYSGRKFNPIDPRVEDISILDIAHGLSNVCRFGGQCKQFYSVAQHSVIVSQNVSRDNARWGLMHDASEAYIGDVISPLKDTLHYEVYREIEDNLMEAVAIRFGLPLEMHPEVKEYDYIVRHTEMRDFGSIPEEFWINEVKLPITIKPQAPWQARASFLETFVTLFVDEANNYHSYL